jgi:hypothetical protein
VTLPQATLAIMVGDRHQNGSHPAKSCQASFGLFFGVLLLHLRFEGNLPSLQLGIIVLSVARCYTKNNLSWTDWTTTQLTMQQGSERTRVKPRSPRLDSRAPDRTNWVIPLAQLTAGYYDLPVVTSHLASGAPEPTMQYCTGTVQYSLT